MTSATETKDRLKELNTALTSKRTEMKSIVDSFKFEPGTEGASANVTITVEQKSAFDAAKKEADEITYAIKALEGFTGVDDFLNAAADGSGRSAGADGATEHALRTARKSLGEMFSESAEYKEYMDGGKSGNSRNFKVEQGDIARTGLGQKDIYTAAGGTFTVPAFGTQQNDGLILPAYRTYRVRDLFPSQRTTANLIEYVRRTGYTNNAAVVPERTSSSGGAATGGPTDVFGLKPASNLTYTPEQAPVRVIAHTIDISKTVLDDVPRLQDTINGEMLYGLRLAEDAELLSGDGTGAHILGILNTPGIQLYTQSAAPTGSGEPTAQDTETKVDAVRKAATLVMLAFYEATGVVLHPFDWEEMELSKTSFGQYVLVMNVAVGAQKQVWQMPVVQTPAMAQGTFLTGAFGLGAKVYDRELANVAISTETRDLFDRNAVALRCEERLALEVARPESMVKGTFIED